MHELTRPLLFYDGDCGFCRAWIARWRRATGDRVEYLPYQEAAARFPGIPARPFSEAVQLLEPDGRWSQGAEAAFRALARAPGGAWAWALYRRLPGFAPASEACYRVVAGNRKTFSLLTRWLWGDRLVPPGETLTVWIFLRLLALVYGIAFVSLWTQIPGLAGHDGILPAGELLRAARSALGGARYWVLPTLAWLDSSDGFLIGLCAAGTAISALLVLGAAPIPCLFALWALYLSLATVSQDFLWFQWDSLLLEAGFLALFLAPWRWWSLPRRDPAPRSGALWLMRWLLFRLTFSSAVVKLASGDPTWRNLTALTYHYQTQPLPPWTAWYAHHLPVAFQRASAGVMFVIEGAVPLLIFAPRRIRFAAAAAMAGLQALILITGNYGFFNLLTLALCVLLLDDAVWPGAARAREAAPAPAAAAHGAWPAWAIRPAVAVFFLLGLVPLLGALRWPLRWLGPLPDLVRVIAPLRTVDSYGLFAVMTTRRPEIVIEGSDDGREWRAYEFRYKPGNLARRPAFVTPHMPRLDWQMWFAALGDFRQNPWFLAFCERLLQGSRPVLALLARNPFPAAPPRYLRATVYDYQFTDRATRRATGAWWRRDPERLYLPVLTLEDGRLRPAPEIPATP